MYQRFPIVYVEDGLVATGIEYEFTGLHLDGLTVSTEQEIQRGDIFGDGYIAVVGVDGGQCVQLYDILRRMAACHAE